MRKHRTPQPPLIDLNRPVTHRWNWEVCQRVASSGYVTSIHVTATARDQGEELVGTAWAEVGSFDDRGEAIAELAVEAMLAACQPTLDGSPPARKVILTAHL